MSTTSVNSESLLKRQPEPCNFLKSSKSLRMTPISSMTSDTMAVHGFPWFVLYREFRWGESLRYSSSLGLSVQQCQIRS